MEAYHNKKVTKMMGTTRKYVRSLKLDQESADDVNPVIPNDPQPAADATLADDDEKLEELMQQLSDNEKKDPPAADPVAVPVADPAVEEKSPPEVRLRNRVINKSPLKLKKPKPVPKTVSREEAKNKCYKCKATEESGACQHVCHMSSCLVGLCGPIAGCSVMVETDDDKAYFCWTCWKPLIKNAQNKKVLKAVKTGKKAVSNCMFSYSGKINDLKGVY